jgi:hypothetical protein
MPCPNFALLNAAEYILFGVFASAVVSHSNYLDLGKVARQFCINLVHVPPLFWCPVAQPKYAGYGISF